MHQIDEKISDHIPLVSPFVINGEVGSEKEVVFRMSLQNALFTILKSLSTKHVVLSSGFNI